MSELEHITHLSKKYFKRIKKITEPLDNQFGITYFARQSITNDGYWEILGNLPDWLDHSASKEFFKVDPSLLHPDYYQSGLVVNSAETVPEFLKDMCQEALLFDINNTLCIYKKTLTGCEWYFFSGSSKNPQIINTYITRINSIYQYINYFNDEAKNILNKNLDFRVDVEELKKEPFGSSSNKLELAPLIGITEDLIRLSDYKISPREKDCLIHLCQGKTIKETAKLLSLSPRTVEEYLNRLKQKAGCRYKRELISFFQKEYMSS